MQPKSFYLLFSICPSVFGLNPIIETVYGPIEGSIQKTIDQNKTFYSFDGIPFGQPPIGDLRFKTPIPPTPWKSILKANNRDNCVGFYDDGVEDCLRLNVYTPRIDSSKMAVIVFIIGGEFVTAMPTDLQPDYFLNEDVVFVSINYRVGLYGFLSTEDSTSPGNYGIYDIILGLHWVQSNIARFGGNPNNVVLCGHSSGAVLVSYILETPLSEGLFHRVILQSGNSLSFCSKAQTPRTTAFELGRKLGIITENSTKLVEEFRQIAVDTLRKPIREVYLKRLFSTNIQDGFIIGPFLEKQNEKVAVIANRSHEMFSNGNFIKVPILTGFTSNEAASFITDHINNILWKSFPFFPTLRIYLIQFDLFFTKLVPPGMNVSTWWSKILAGFQIHWYYFGLRLLFLTTDKLIQYVSDELIVRSTHEFIRLVSKHVPTYVYYFSYDGVLGKPNKRYKGVAHTEELHYLFNWNDIIPKQSQSDSITRYRLVRMWINFAKFGNPTPVKDELLMNMLWPTVTEKGVPYMNIGEDLKVENDMKIWKNIPFWTKLYKKFGNPPYDKY